MSAQTVQAFIPAASIPQWWDAMHDTHLMDADWCEADTPLRDVRMDPEATVDGCHRPKGHTGRHLGVTCAAGEGSRQDREVLVVWGERYVTPRRQLMAALGHAVDASAPHGHVCGVTYPDHPEWGPCLRLPGHGRYSPPHWGYINTDPSAPWERWPE